MSSGLVDAIARIARHEAAARPVAGVGRVTAVHTSDGAPADHAVTVELRDTKLVLPRVPVAVGLLGYAAIPAVDELVVVVFVDADYHAPVVVGRLYPASVDPPEHAPGQAVVRLPAGSAEPTLQLVVDQAAPTVTLDLPQDVHVEIGAGSVHIEVGELHARLESAGGGRVEIAAGESTVTLKSSGDIAVKAAGTLSLEGTQVAISGTAKVSIKGALVELN
jgi:uncharacterized protein involved in type VI secretion and phage assembly